MCIFIGVWVGLSFDSSFLLCLKLLLLSSACRFLSLLFGKLFCLEKSLLFLCLFQNSLPLRIKLLLLEFLLSCSGRFGAEILHFLLLVCHFHLSFLFFDDSLHLSLLHQSHLRHQRVMANSRGQMCTLCNGCISDG